jgi:hypothetical protein
MKQKLLFSFLLLTFFFPSLLSAQCFPAWGSYMPITIANPNASTLTDFQVKLTVNTAALIGAGQMLANGDDIRFSDGLCNNIDYWIESGINTAATSIWVKVPSLTASGNTTIYMYYNNPSATAAENGDNVFLFFDDFNGASLNLSKWTVHGTPSTLSQSGGALTIVGNFNWEYISSNTTWSGPVVIESRESTAGPSAAMVLGYTGSDNRYTFRENSVTKGTTYDNDVSGGNAWFDMAYPNVEQPNSGFNNYEIKTDLVGNVITISSYCDKTTSNCNTNTTSLNQFTGSSYYVGYSTYGVGYTLNSDWIFVHSFAAQDLVPTNGPSQQNIAISCSVGQLDYCPGSFLGATFTPSTTFNPGNTYTLQLSDNSGSFNSPYTIVTITSSSAGLQAIGGLVPYVTPGNLYRVRIVASSPAFTGSDNGIDLTIYPPPIITATSNPQTICSGSSSTLTATGAVNYSWSSGGNAATEIVSPTSASSYTVTGIDMNGCVGTAITTVSVNPLPNVTANPASATICAGTNETMTASGATSYSWSSGGNTATEIVTPATSTNYTVTGTDGNGCTNTAIVALTVNPLPVVTASAASGTICDGSSETLTASGATTYSWSSGGSAATEIVTPTTTSNYTVTGTDGNGCVNTATVSVTVNPLPAVGASAASGTICNGASETLTASGATTYSWSSGGNTSTEIVSPTSTSNYTVTGTDGNGCVNTATVLVTVNPLPVVNLGQDIIQCGGSVVLDAQNAGSTYVWNDNSTAQTLTASASGNYFVTVTSANGCIGGDTVAVTINVLPTVTGTPTQTSVCLSDGSVTLNGTPAGGTWSGPGVNASSFLPATAGVGAQTVTYTFTDANGCTGSASAVITVNGCAGITEQTNANVVTVYPNPSNGEFTLNLSGNETADVIVYDAIGQRVQDFKVTPGVSANVKIDVAGVYFLDVTTASGKRETLKVVVNK